METETVLNVFGALSQRTRLEAFNLLVRHDPDGLSAGEIARQLKVPQNTLSAHFNVLTHAGLVTSKRQSRSIIYRAELSTLEMLMLYLLKDCCHGRPDIRKQMIESVMRQMSSATKER